MIVYRSRIFIANYYYYNYLEINKTDDSIFIAKPDRGLVCTVEMRLVIIGYIDHEMTLYCFCSQNLIGYCIFNEKSEENL